MPVVVLLIHACLHTNECTLDLEWYDKAIAEKLQPAKVKDDPAGQESMLL